MIRKYIDVSKKAHIRLPKTHFHTKIDRIDLLRCLSKKLLLNRYSPFSSLSIPEDVIEEYSGYRETPIIRSTMLEKKAGITPDTDIRILFKDESRSPTGSFKYNAAVPTIHFGEKEGFKKVICASGAGQWGHAIALAASKKDMDCTVNMLSTAYDTKKKRVKAIRKTGAEVIRCNDGGIFENTMDMAMRHAINQNKRRDGKRIKTLFPGLGLEMFQSIMGTELSEQIRYEYDDINPSTLIAPAGSGSCMMGFSAGYLDDKHVELLAVESSNSPKLSEGIYSSVRKDNQLMIEKKYHLTEPKKGSLKNPAQGLMMTASAKLLSSFVHNGFIRSIAVKWNEAKRISDSFKKTTGLIPAPETAYAMSAAVNHAKKMKALGRKGDIIFCLSGNGKLD